MKRNHIWVIEMLLEGKWEACSDCAFTRKEAQNLMDGVWKVNNTDDKFRVWKYQSVPERRRAK